MRSRVAAWRSPAPLARWQRALWEPHTAQKAQPSPRSSRSPKQVAKFFAAAPTVAISENPGLAPPTFCTISLIARPIVRLARFSIPEPRALRPEFRPILSLTGPLITMTGAADIVVAHTPWQLKVSVQMASSAASTTGNADIEGTGTGAGGIGNGTGSGNNGTGAGSGGYPPVPARLISGRITPKDYPRSAADANVEGIVGANVYIGANGRVTRCVVKISSGNQALDDTTCRLITQRFRYEPARGTDGRPVADIAGWEQRWWLGRDRDR
mgnify:CR=1 FL=1